MCIGRALVGLDCRGWSLLPALQLLRYGELLQTNTRSAGELLGTHD